MISTERTKNGSVINSLIKEESGILTPLKTGDLVQGEVMEKGSKMILVDLGKYGTGAIYGGEIINAREMVRKLKVGDEASAKVVDIDNEEGYVELSIAEAGKQKSWEEVIALKEKDEPFEITPVGYNKGGLMAEVAGLKAFLPLSQLSPEHYPQVDDGDKAKITEELQSLVNEEFLVKIIDINQKQNKLIVSEREAKQESRKELLENYEVGQIVTGVISGVASFGAFFRFADNPALEGLIHISELDHKIVENPKSVVSVDDEVKAKIIEIKDGRIYLSLKALKENPWETAGKSYEKGQEVSGKVYSFTPFGALVSLGDLQGQIHVTEFGSVEEMKKKLKEGETYDFVVSESKPEEKRIYLKLKK